MSRRTITYILIAVVVTGGLFAFSRARAGQQAQAQLAELQTVEAQTGALVATIGATGTVRANQSANLLWQTSGRVELVSVEVGDEVSGGDLLAALAQTSLPQNVILAEADLVSAREALDDLYQSFEGLGLAQASQALADAEKAVAEAERYLLNVSSPAPDIDIDQAHANVVLTQSALDRAYDRYKPYENKAETNQIRAVLLNAYAQAQKDYDAAVRVLNHLTGGGSILDIGVAEADLEVAKAQLAEAQAEYDRLAAGPAADEIAAAQARVAAAEATLKLALIEAPFDGVVTQAEPKPGDLVTPNETAFRLDDLSRLLVDVEVSEVDINRIEAGQDVVLTFDAILAKEYAGTVVQVSPVGSEEQGIVNFRVTVELSEFDEAVKPGMTAGVNIVVSQLENVLLAPNRAVRVLDGQRVVYILEGGQLTPVAITLGASSETHSEVLDGELEEGDLIALNPPTVFQGGPGGGPFGGN